MAKTTTAKNAEKLMKADNIAQASFNKLNKLRNEAETWEKDFYNPTMDKLYGLLSKALAELTTLRKEGSDAQNYFKDHMKNTGFTVTDGTSLELCVVRLVFGIEGKEQRANRYAKVLKIAYDRKVTAEDFAKWVVEEGGIDEIRRGTSQKTNGTDYEQIAIDFYTTATAMPQTDLSDASLANVDFSDFRLLVVRKNCDASYSAVSDVDNLKLIKSALHFLGKKIDKEQGEKTKQAHANKQQAEAINAASDNQNEAETEAKVQEAA